MALHKMKKDTFSKIIISTFLIGVFLLAGCIEQPQNNSITPAQNLTVNVNNESTPDKGFLISCSGGVSCDNPEALRIFQYRDHTEYIDQNLNFLLFFEPSLSNNYSLESFKQNFSKEFRPVVTIKFPEKSDLFYDWSFYTNHDIKAEFQKYENNVLTGRIEFFIDQISRQKKESRCMVADAAPPADCIEIKSFGKTMVIQFELTVNPAQK